ncbi:hypothetical protein E2C01_040313 [Portunus trituberculatus]|uniref:Uncharacterized protein n=1 Tax=Portunus trituberculatus TaxID=210409 RepID=A0A5B7FH74_PORTR|nr:hypothetical protein [Portunus trituberculatus]
MGAVLPPCQRQVRQKRLFHHLDRRFMPRQKKGIGRSTATPPGRSKATGARATSGRDLLPRPSPPTQLPLQECAGVATHLKSDHQRVGQRDRRRSGVQGESRMVSSGR